MALHLSYTVRLHFPEVRMCECFVHDLDDPFIRPFLTLRTIKTPPEKESGVFVAEGEKVVCSLLNSSLEVLRFLAAEHYYEKYAPMLDAKGVPTAQRYIATEEQLAQIVGFRMHQGIMALGKKPLVAALEELKGMIVVLNGLANAENVGAIVRNCAAFGVSSLIIDRKCSSPFLRRSVKVSMGAVFSMKLHETEDLTLTLDELKNKGSLIVGADPGKGSIPLRERIFNEPCVLVIGSEGRGLDEKVRKACDQLVGIPISDSIDSLNAAAASAVFLYAMKG